MENKMGTMPVNRLLISMALPMMVSMLVQALYNVVDSIFVAKLSEDALTAVSLAFPMQNLMISTATGLGVGINALLSRSLGQKNFDRANKTAKNGIFLEICAYALFLILGLTIIRPFYEIQAGKGEITEMGIEYLSVITVCGFGIFGQIAFERLLQSTGKTLFTMFTQGCGAIINIILDPIFIFGLLGVPKMGVRGAAVATVIGQIAAAVLALIFNILKNKEINISFRKFRPDGEIIKTILSVGIPSIIMVSISSIMTFCMNKILIVFSSTAVAVFGVYFKLQSFVFMPVYGLNNGMVPIISYNYGAGHRDRLMRTVYLSVSYALIIMALGLAVIQIFPDKLLLFFDASEHMLSIGTLALRIISLSFIFAGVSIVLMSVLQALGRGFSSMLVSIIRQLIILVPAAFGLSKIGGLNAVWWAFPLAEFAAIIISLSVFRSVYNRVIKNIGK